MQGGGQPRTGFPYSSASLHLNFASQREHPSRLVDCPNEMIISVGHVHDTIGVCLNPARRIKPSDVARAVS